MARISLERVSKTFRQGPAAVRDLSLAIAQGELIVLVGPSGSGKSTVLRLIAGLESPSEGRILIDDQDVTAVPAQARDLAMVFQSYALYPHKTVRENLGFGLRMRNLPRAETARRIAQVAESLDIAALLDRKPGQLSGGQRQRVALGRAIVREPRAFLLDEPLSNLDPQLRGQARTELMLLHRRLSATMVHVTHDQEEAMTLGTRLAVLRDGVLQQVATPMEVYREPANGFVARFIGSPRINLFPCEVNRHGRGLVLTNPALALDLDEAEAPGLGAGDGARDVLVGIRPHDIDLADGSEAECRGVVQVTEMLGSSQIIHVRASPGELLIRVLAPPEVGLRVDDVVGLRLRRSGLLFFDRHTEHRISA